MSKNFAKTGKDVYEGIKYLLQDIFELKEEYTHDELIEKFDDFRDLGYSLYIYKDWNKAYDFLKLLIKFSIINYEDNMFCLDINGINLKNKLKYSEEEFKDSLFEIAYLSSFKNAIRFREFCDYLRYSLIDSEIITIERFELAKENILKASQMTNRNAIDFLFSLGVISKTDNEIRINSRKFAKINTEEIALCILRSNLDKNKSISLEQAEQILIANRINPNIINKLQIIEKIIIRSVRTGKYIDFS